MGANEVHLLGRFAVTIGGRRIPDDAWKHSRGAHLVKLLALAGDRTLHRERVIDALWPDMTPAAGTANLRKAVHHARNALGEPSAIASSGPLLTLLPGRYARVDAVVFESAARDALQRGDADSCEGVARTYAGDLLPEDAYEEWTVQPRINLQTLYRRLLKTARLWDAIIEIDRTDEEAAQGRMMEALGSGDRIGTVRTFERLREALRVDLGVGPSPASIELYEKALAMEGHGAPTPAERARRLIAWGLVQWHGGDLDEAERTAEEARAIAIEASLGREIGDASALLGLVASRQGRWPELFRSEFLRTIRDTPSVAPVVFDAHLCLGEFFLNGALGHEHVAPFARELFDIARNAGSVHGEALATLMLGEVELLSGRLDEARRLLVTATKLHDRVRASTGACMALERRAVLELIRGRRADSVRLIPRAMRLAETSHLAPHLIVRVHAARIGSAADDRAAGAAVRDADRRLAAIDVCPPCSMGYRLEAAGVDARTGSLDAARTRVEEAERIAAMWQGGPWTAAVWETRAALRRAEGHQEQAAALFREAAGLFSRFNRPLDVARCLRAAENP